MEIICLRTHVTSGIHTYPIYMGFGTAAEIARVAVAPAFTRTTDNQRIADNISSQPVRDWQRPIDEHRVSAIAETFDNTGGLMPNPVLLAMNPFVTGGVSIEPLLVHGYQTGSHQVAIAEDAATPEDKPLWILDGQHRIFGLSESAQRENLVPLVLLLNEPAGGYTSPGLAKIFAQVTTAAKKLDDLHNEWLTYAFDLGRYSDNNPNRDAAKKAFKTVVELCRTPDWGGFSNPFFNSVQFNEWVDVAPSLGGFAFRCNSLSEILLRNYYSVSPQVAHLDPPQLAEEIARAYVALNQVITGHPTSVFFGSADKQQVIMQEAYLVGILARTLAHGSTADYRVILQTLNFQHSNWDFGWIRSLGGQENTASRRIARDVFDDALATTTLPAGSSNLVDHLRGNGASVTLACSKLTPAGYAAQQGRTNYVALRGSVGSHNVALNPHIRVAAKTTNVGGLEISDKTQPRVKYQEMAGRGLLLQPPLPRPLVIEISMQHYGGHYSQAELELNW